MDLVKIRKKAKKGQEDRVELHTAPSPASVQEEPKVEELTPPAQAVPTAVSTDRQDRQAEPKATEEGFLKLAEEELISRYEEEAKREEIELICFTLSDEEYALNIMDVKEVIKPRGITEIPRVPEFILGVISLRGTVIPIFDLGRRLNLEAKEVTKNTRIIIASDEDKTLGMIVDRVTQVKRLDITTLEPPPPVIGGVEADFIQAVGRDGEKPLILLNLKKVLEIKI